MTKVKNPKLKNPIEKYFKEITLYHYYLFSLLFLSKLLLFWHILNLIFLSPPISFDCSNITTSDGAENLSGFKNPCPCDEPIWDRSVFTQTVQTKFGVYCARSWLLTFSQSMLYAGLLIGSLIFGFLSDRYGRLSMYMICATMIAVFGSLVSVMPDITSYICMRFFEGVGAGGGLVICFVLCIEYCGVKHREAITALFHLPGNLAHLSLAGISYWLRDCDNLQLALSVPVFAVISYKWLLMESPKWLMDNNRVDEAASVMERIFRFNKKPCVNLKEQIETYHSTHSEKIKSKIKFWEIFKHRKLAVYFCCMSVIYFVCGMGYYGVSQFIGKMGGDIHANVAISGTLLLPGTVASIFLLKILPRRKFLMATNFLSGIFMLIVVCIPDNESNLRLIRVGTACVCNAFFFMSFIIVFLYGVELFPTSIRNSALGVLSVLSRIGQVVTPPINEMSEFASGIVYGVMAIVGAALCYPLPETKNTELPSSLDDTKTLTKRTVRLEEDTATDNVPLQTSRLESS